MEHDTDRLRISRARRRALRLCAAALTLFALACGSAVAEESERLAAAMGLEPGMTIADVGAGDGEWSEKLAELIGPEGHVYATEIDEDDVKKMKKRFKKAGLQNVTAVLGQEDATGLSDGCCDAILLRMVYHHFTDPETMRKSLHDALKPGGLLVVVDIEPHNNWRKLEDVPDRGGHGVLPDELARELTTDCFHFVERQDDWNGDDERYMIVFQR